MENGCDVFYKGAYFISEGVSGAEAFRPSCSGDPEFLVGRHGIGFEVWIGFNGYWILVTITDGDVKLSHVCGDLEGDACDVLVRHEVEDRFCLGNAIVDFLKRMAMGVYRVHYVDITL